MIRVDNFLWAIYLLTFITISAIVVVLIVLIQRLLCPTSLPPNAQVPHGGGY
nr:p6 [Pineapple mealybug wilt-associated virus 3]